MSGSSGPAVLDSTVLSNFAYLEETDRLRILPQPITVPAVERELRTGTASHDFLSHAVAALGDTVPVRPPPETEPEPGISNQLDPGEREAFVVAVRDGGILATDDGTARSLARERDVQLTGTLGVLLRLVETGRISEATADEWLTRLIDEAGYRAPSRTLSDYL